MQRSERDRCEIDLLLTVILLVKNATIEVILSDTPLPF